MTENAITAHSLKELCILYMCKHSRLFATLPSSSPLLVDEAIDTTTDTTTTTSINTTPLLTSSLIIPKEPCQQLVDQLSCTRSVTLPMLLQLRNSRFTNLNLSMCGRVTDEWMILLRDLPLTKLNLSHCLLSNQSFTYFKPYITYQQISTTSSTTSSTTTTTTTTTDPPTVRGRTNSLSNGRPRRNSLNNKNNNNNDKKRNRSNSLTTISIVKGYEICETLTHLNLSQIHEISYDGLKIICKSFKCIKILNLEGCHGISNKCLQVFNNKSYSIVESLTSLNIRQCSKISCIGVKNLKLLKNLTWLNISDNPKISNDSMKCIGEHMKLLQYLYLHGNDRISCQSLKHLSHHLNQLRSLDISGIGKILSFSFLLNSNNKKKKNKRNKNKNEKKKKNKMISDDRSDQSTNNHNNNKRNRKRIQNDQLLYEQYQYQYTYSNKRNRYDVSSSDEGSSSSNTNNNGDDGSKTEDTDDDNDDEMELSFPMLTHLNLSDTVITADASTFPVMKSLRSLQLNYCKSLSAASIGTLLSKCQELTSVELSSTLLTDISLQSLNTLTVEYVDVSFCRNISDQSIIQTIGNCSELKHFYGRSLKQLTSVAFYYLFKKCHQKLLTLCIPGCFHSDQPEQVPEQEQQEQLIIEEEDQEEMEMNVNAMNPARHFAALKNCVHLQLLDLSHSNQLKDEWLQMTLPHLKSLTWIDFTNCIQLTHAIIPCIIELKDSVSHLALSDCPKIDSAMCISLNQLYKLECLYMSNSTISNDQLFQLLSNFPHNKLMDLSLMNCNQLTNTTEAIHTISTYCSKILALNLYGLPVTDKGVYYLKRLKNLNRLRMSTSHLLTEKGDQYLHELENLIYLKTRSLREMSNRIEMRFQRP